MKSSRATALWAVPVLALAGYSFWDYQKNKGAPALQSGERMAFSLKRDEINHIFFKRGDQAVELERKEDEWHMLKPVDDFAEDAVIDGFLFGLMSEKIRSFREESSAVDWSKYGLAPPGVTVELKTPRVTEKIEVSTKNAFDGSFYVRQNDEILAGATSLAQSTNRQVNSFRTKRIWRHADANVTAIRVAGAGPGEQFDLRREKGAWVFTPRPKFALDPERIEKWVNAVQDLSAGEIVSDDVNKREEFELTKPRYQVHLDYQTGEEKPGRWTLTLGRDKGADAFFYTNDRAAILKGASSAVRKIEVTPDYFRDGHEPFAFDAEAARVVEVKSGKIEFKAKREGSGWTLVSPKPGQTLDEPAFRDFVAALGALRAVDFPGSAVKVKASPAVRISGADQKTLFSLSLGEAYAPKAGWNEGAQLRAVSTRDGSSFGLPKPQIETLISEKLIKVKPAPAPAPKAEAPPHE